MQPDSASAVMIAVTGSRNARTSRTEAIPESETVPVLHRLWLTKGLPGADGKFALPVLHGESFDDQALTPTPIGHDTPVPPKPQ